MTATSRWQSRYAIYRELSEGVQHSFLSRSFILPRLQTLSQGSRVGLSKLDWHFGTCLSLRPLLTQTCLALGNWCLLSQLFSTHLKISVFRKYEHLWTSVVIFLYFLFTVYCLAPITNLNPSSLSSVIAELIILSLTPFSCRDESRLIVIQLTLFLFMHKHFSPACGSCESTLMLPLSLKLRLNSVMLITH